MNDEEFEFSHFQFLPEWVQAMSLSYLWIGRKLVVHVKFCQWTGNHNGDKNIS